jgi:hypothetical protein
MRTGSTASDWLLARRNHLTLLFLVFLYLSAVVVVNPAGNFPLNDDWSWAAAARNLALGHDWRPTGWTGMPLITHSLWAAPFCILTDCSYEALRASTLVAGLLLLISSYYLFASVTKSTFAASLAAATVAFNPVIFELSYTFMTDTLFTALLVTSTFVFLKTFRSNSPYLFALACVLAVASTLCRQVGLCVPVAYLVVNVFRPDERAQKIFRSLLPVVLCVLALVGFNYWMQQTGRLPALYYFESARLINAFRHPISLIQTMSLNLVVTLLYLGLFCSPLLILRRTPDYDGASPLLRWAPTAVAAAAALVVVAGLWRQLGLMPVGANILLPVGLGPLTLRDTWVLHLNNVPPLPTYFWVAVTALSLFGLFKLVELGGAFVVTIFDRDRKPTEVQTECYFAAACTVIYLSPFFVVELFDRYIAAIVPMVCLFILAFTQPARASSSATRVLAGATCTCIALFGVLGTHDYLSWNRARWQAIADLERLDHANSSNIDGGFEFNGSTSYDSNYQPTPGMSWWWVKDDTYQVTFGRVPGMSELRRYRYTTYLPPGTRFIHALRRLRPVDGKASGR